MNTNFRYPVFLDLTGKRCLVTGQGYEVPGKVEGLVDAAAQVTYVNPTADPRIELLANHGQLQWQARDFHPSDLDTCFLVMTCGPRNAEIFALAEARGILCNAVDDPRHCRYSYGAKHTQGDLTIAISSNGVAPALAVRIKEKLQRQIGPEYAHFLQLMRELRPAITAGINDFGKRRDLWYRLVDSDILSLLREGRREAAEALAHQLIEQAKQSP